MSEDEDEGPYHLYPINDLEEHRLDEFCKCKPVWTEPGMWVHNSFDGREHVEELTNLNNINLN